MIPRRLLALRPATPFLFAATLVLSPPPAPTPENRFEFVWQSVRSVCPLNFGLGGGVRDIPFRNNQYEMPGPLAGCRIVVTWRLKSEIQSQNPNYASALMQRAGNGTAGKVFIQKPEDAPNWTEIGAPQRPGNGWEVTFAFERQDVTAPFSLSLVVTYLSDEVRADPGHRAFVTVTPYRPAITGPLTAVRRPGAPAGGGAPSTTPTYGWQTAITTSTIGNLGLAIGTRLGNAEDTIAGNTIRAIVTDPNVRVRADNFACQACHASTTWGSPQATRDAFCGMVDDFDATANKPQILKDLFNNWAERNCPD